MTRRLQPFGIIVIFGAGMEMLVNGALHGLCLWMSFQMLEAKINPIEKKTLPSNAGRICLKR